MRIRIENEICTTAIMVRRCRLHFLAALIVGVVLVSGVFAQTSVASDAASDSVVACDLRSEMKSGFLQLSAVARSKIPVSGRYHLVVSKHSESGSSENAQSGAFALKPHREQVLTTTLLDGGAVGHYRAKLSIETNAGKVSCTSP